MSNGINTDPSSYIDSVRWNQQNKPVEKDDTLNQEDFFSLLTQQLSYQDPSKPADNDQMIAQMTSFTMAEGISNLNSKFESLSTSMTSNSALQASTLVGKKALLESDTIDLGVDQMPEGSIIATKPLDQLKISIFDEKNQLVRQIDMGKQAPGAIRFDWDGLDGNGNKMPDGAYTVKAEGLTNGTFTGLPLATFKNIDSVNINGSNGIIINTKDGPVKLTDVAEIA